MKKNDRHITDDLLLRYLRNHVNDEQKKTVEEWLSKDETNRSHLEEIRNLWSHSAFYSSFDKIDVPGDWQKVSQRLGLETRSITMQPSRKNQFGSLLRIAALAIVLLSISYLTWNIVANQGLPARQIALATGEETSTIDLPDGSTIYLNSHSELTYPKRLGKRHVKLTGEAFFEVEPDEHKPFIISAGEANIKVLGTSFNVCSASDKLTVSVTDGKVKLYSPQNEDQAILLIKGEHGIYQDKILIKYDTIDPNVFSWKTGILQFDQSPLPKVIRSLEKHYNVIIQYEKIFRKDPRLTSVFEDQPLEEVLEELNLLLGLEYRQKNDTIFVQIE